MENKNGFNNMNNIDLLSLMKKLSENYDSYKDKSKFFIYLWDKMNLSPSGFRNLYNDLCLDFSVGFNVDKDTMSFIRKIDNVTVEYNEFYNSFFRNSVDDTINKSVDDLYSIFNLIDDFLDRKDNLYLLIYYLIDVKNMVYKDFTVYNKMIGKYCYDYSRGNISTFRLKSVYNFNRMYSLYKGIIRQPAFIVDLIHGKNDEKFIKFLYYVLYRNGITIDALKKQLSKYSDDSDVCKFVSRYNKYCSICLRRKEEKKHDEKIMTAYNVIREYLDGNYYNLDCYCESINISKTLFESYVNLMKENNNPIYDEYAAFSEKQRSTKFSLLMDKLRTIISLIKDGIVEDDVTREFDLLDYYSYTKLSFDEIKKLARDKVSSSDYAALTMFCSKYDEKVLNTDSIQKLFNMNNNFFCKISNDGEIIDTGYEATIYDKKHVINVLNARGIPLTSSTYSLMLKKYINQKLNVDNKNTIKR